MSLWQPLFSQDVEKVRTSQCRRTFASTTMTISVQDPVHKNPQGSWVRCHVSSCPFAPCIGFSEPRAADHTPSGWVDWGMVASAEWEEGNVKGQVRRGWPNTNTHRCISGQIGLGKVRTNLQTHSSKFQSPGTPWKIFQRTTPWSQKYYIINSQSHLKISQEEEPLFSLFLTWHYDF